MPINVKVTCADGTVPKQPLDSLAGRGGPVLTHEEMEDKYRMIYDKYGKRPDPNPNVNFAFIVLLALVGLSTTLVIPYCLFKSKKHKGGLAGSFATMLQQSKKKSVGRYD